MVSFNKYSYGVGVRRRAEKKYLLDRKPRLSRVLWPLLLTPHWMARLLEGRR